MTSNATGTKIHLKAGQEALEAGMLRIAWVHGQEAFQTLNSESEPEDIEATFDLLWNARDHR